MAIITVSRKVGSWGETISKLAAEKLGYRVVTPEEFHRLAEACDSDFKKACSVFETEMPGGMIERFFLREPAYTSLFEALNFELAAGGDVVIWGRGAQIVLADQPGVFHVRVVAPFELRVRRIMERDSLDYEVAAGAVKRFDRQRRTMIEAIYHKDRSDWGLYDLVINTAHIANETAANMIFEAVKNIAMPPDWEDQKRQFKDLGFAKRVESAIKLKLHTGPYRNIEVENKGKGRIILRGFITDKRSLDLALDIASGYPGVTEVENRLKEATLSF